MSKIRIYELARELGVDNRVVIARAIELGLQGKSSHSNSLESDEADQIRRAIIRQAMGGEGQVQKNGGTKSVQSEVVTTRVDKSTGHSEAIVERRKGNVIMRRRQNSPEGVVGSQQGTGGGDAEQLPEAQLDEQLTSTEPTFSPNVSASPNLLADAPSSEVEQEVELPEPQESEEVVVGEAVEPSEEEFVAEPVEVVEVEEPVAVDAPKPIPEKKPVIGPRVLGRIELPVKRPARPDVARTRGPVPVTPQAVPVEDDDGGKKKLAKGKSKKREISRLDLVDYEGREARRVPRNTRSSRDDGQRDRAPAAEAKATKASKRVVKIDEFITVGELARQMSLKSSEVISKLIGLGIMATINQAIDKDTATILAEEFGFTMESTSVDENEIIADEGPDDPAQLQPRPPVVTVMGHVDHGKTSLLDKIRQASVAQKEAGGITQHIGAYSVTLPNDRKIAFIDTPGHAAFTAMRARGAKVTDVVILVVAADDGVMPQTIEAINHAKAAGVPIVVALNKMDKGDAQPDRVKQQLVEHGLQPEDWGGDTMYYPVSAIKGTGIQELLEGVLLQAEILDLKANPQRRAKGTIIESRQDRGRGSVATILIQTGTLRIGDTFACGAEYGRVRSIHSHIGERIEEAGPSTPVEITGLSGIALAGDDFFVTESEAAARQISSLRSEKSAKEERLLSGGGPMTLEEFARRSATSQAQELNVIVKADVHGSLEAVRTALEQLSTEKVKVRVIHAAVGGISESDIQLAIASRAVVIGFGVRAEPRAVVDAEQAGIDLRFYRIIYELLDDVKKAMVGLLAPVKQEVFLGRAEVRETFVVPKIGTIAGSYVLDGMLRRGSLARVLRDSRVVYEGKMASLRRFKDDVREVQRGYECGIGIENFNDVKIGDVVEVFEQKEIAATL